MSQVLENNNNNGLQLDSVFIRALQQDATLMAAIGSRLYGTAIPLPDEDVDNVPELPGTAQRLAEFGNLRRPFCLQSG